MKGRGGGVDYMPLTTGEGGGGVGTLHTQIRYLCMIDRDERSAPSV